MAKEVANSELAKRRTRTAVEDLAIIRCDALSTEQEQEIRASGYDLDQILADEGIGAEALHDAVFLTEPIARATLGTNYERVVASSEHYQSTIESLRPLRVIDLGGGCGITCFDAARTWTDCDFVVCDRSRNVLEIGSRWAQRLNLTNVSFRRLDFTESNLESVLGRDNDLIVFEYVFTLSPEHEVEPDIIAQISPGMKTAAQLLRSTGKICIRFGEFCEQGLTGLIRAAHRNGLFVFSISAGATGCTFIFTREPGDDSEDAEVFRALDDFGCQFRAMDSRE
jgi:SAM-dependent methyltransferase